MLKFDRDLEAFSVCDQNLIDRDRDNDLRIYEKLVECGNNDAFGSFVKFYGRLSEAFIESFRLHLDYKFVERLVAVWLLGDSRNVDCLWSRTDFLS